LSIHAVFAKVSTYTNISDNGQETGRWYFDYKKQEVILNYGKGDKPDKKMKIEHINTRHVNYHFR
jgi:hypothetical protein